MVVFEQRAASTSSSRRPEKRGPVMINYGCPKCGAAISTPKSMAGQTETCAQCGNVAIVPSKAAAPGKSVSGLGVISVVCGIFALFGSWASNIMAVFLAAVGFVLGSIAFLGAVIARKTKSGVPAAGVLLSIAAMVILILRYFGWDITLPGLLGP